MTRADISAAVRAWIEADVDLRRRMHLSEANWSDEYVGRVERSVAHLLRTDPGGSWVTEAAGEVVGLAQANRRDGLWTLSRLFVSPSAQDSGRGGVLLERALAYAEPDDRKLIVSSTDPRAIRRYSLAGFSLHPAVAGRGELRRARVGQALQVKELDGSEVERTVPVDRKVRGAARPEEIALCLAEGDRLLALDGRGYVVIRGPRVCMLVALDEDAAATLLMAALAELPGDGPVEVPRIVAGQQWAVRVASEAGLGFYPHGPLMLKGQGPFSRPHLPDGALG